MLFLPIRTIDLSKAPEQWAVLFQRTWPSYQQWFLNEGYKARAGYLTSVTAFEAQFPELAPTFHRLCEEVGGGDLTSRYLSMFCPPPYMSGCSQIAWSKEAPFLIRNYDYSPRYFEGHFVKTNYLKSIMGMSDCSWGLLDGVNEDGLCASLTFGGRRITSTGFGIPLIIRYCLETCSNTKDAIERLKDIPAHMSYNVTLFDADNEFATIYFVPGGRNQIHTSPIGTNHQEEITWPDYATLTKTVERRNLLESALNNPNETTGSLIQKFLHPPLFNTAYEKAFGTLYTAMYSPTERYTRLVWQNKQIEISLEDFREQRLKIILKSNAHRLITV